MKYFGFAWAVWFGLFLVIETAAIVNGRGTLTGFVRRTFKLDDFLVNGFELFSLPTLFFVIMVVLITHFAFRWPV